MNIYTLPGKLVKVVTDEDGKVINGYESDKERILKHLNLGEEYEVDHTDVHSSSTNVYLVKFPNISFNSVNFYNVTEQTKDEDHQHQDYYRYND